MAVLARHLFDTGIYSVMTSGAAIGVGWRLHFYTAGGASPITTYNDRTAGAANANPIVSDADGRFPEAWIEENQTIKWVLADDSDNVKATLDDFLISPAPATVAAGLTAFLAGSSALPVASGGTGSTTAPNALTALGALPAAGGTVSGNITRNAKGAHVYFNDAAMTKPVIYITTAAAADPRSGSPGEIWLKY